MAVGYWLVICQGTYGLSTIHVQYCDIMRFTIPHNRHHKVSRSSCIAKIVTILLRIRVRGHFGMSVTKNHESHYVKVLDNPRGSRTNNLFCLRKSKTFM